MQTSPKCNENGEPHNVSQSHYQKIEQNASAQAFFNNTRSNIYSHWQQYHSHSNKTQNMNNTTTSNPKKQCLSVVKEEVVVDGGGGGGKWESLNPEILALIFTRLSAEERVGVLPLVCKSFAACVHGPYCWAEIDIDQWCRKMDRTGFQVDSAVRKLVRRTRGTVRRLSAFKVGDPGFAYVANWYE